MCFTDTSAADSVDLSTAAMSSYKCNACGNKFKGMGSKLSCPACRSFIRQDISSSGNFYQFNAIIQCIPAHCSSAVLYDFSHHGANRF